MKEDKLAELNAIERFALAAGRLANGSTLSKDLQYYFLRTSTYSWCLPAMNRRTYVDNIDWLIAPPSDRGVVVACNHRTFFDSYLYMFALYRMGAKWPRNIYFPVRSDFFYESVAGMLVNFAVGGGVMYPPIYRDRSRRALNDDALDRISKHLQEPYTMVGMHPEGTRNKNDDPYTLLPAQPGIGAIVLRTNPIVVPVFVNGLTNDFIGSMQDSFRPNVRRDNPTMVCFGDPVDYSEFSSQKPRATLYKKCADKIMADIARCGERERELRAKIKSGEIGDDDPHWLYNC